MSYLSNTVITVDAILTKKGRELLAKNDGSFKITQVAFGDDEIDYTLYNPSHPKGSAFYGEAIENTPILEAFPDETQLLKSKLVTLPRGTSKLPVVSIGYNSINLKQGASLTITPQTLNYLNATSTYEPNGYAVTVSDSRFLSIFKGVGVVGNQTTTDVISTTTGTNLSKTEIGTSFTLTGTTLDTLFGSLTSIVTNITVVGRDSGARITIPLTITKK